MDAVVRETYPAVFFFWYYTRDKLPEYIEFEAYVKNRSASEFQYFYDEDEEVRKTTCYLYH